MVSEVGFSDGPRSMGRFHPGTWEVPRPSSTHLSTSKHGMVHIKAPGPTILQLQEHWSPTADFTAISQNLITANTVTVQENCRSVVMGAKGSC